MTEPTRTPRRNKTPLLVLTLIFAAIGIYWGVKHFGTWQYQESSENAYVNGHLVQISAQIPGRVSQILVDDNDTVQAGQVLAVLDDNNAVLALEKARSQLIQAVRQNARLHSSVNAAQAQSAAQLADVKRAQVAVQKAEADWKRREALRGVDAVSAEEAAHAKNALDNARATLRRNRRNATRWATPCLWNSSPTYWRQPASLKKRGWQCGVRKLSRPCRDKSPNAACSWVSKSARAHR